LNELPTTNGATIAELAKTRQRIRMSGFAPSWNAIPNITSDEVALLTQLESPNVSVRTVLESKQHFAEAIELLAADALSNDGKLQQYLRNRGLTERTIEGVAENFRSFFISTTILDKEHPHIAESILLNLLANSKEGIEKIVIKGDGVEGASAGGKFVKTYHLPSFSHPVTFLNQVLHDMHMDIDNTATHFPLMVQPWVAGISRSVQLSLPQRYIPSNVNLVDFALTHQAFQPDSNQFSGAVAEFKPFSSVTKNPEQATHILLAIEAIIHQILIRHGFPKGLPELINTKAFTTFGMDFLQTPENHIKLIDLNPRMTGVLHLLAQSHQQNFSGESGLTMIPLQALTTQELTTLVEEQGQARTTSLLGNFIHGLLKTLGKQNNVELLPLKTELLTFPSPFHNNQPMAIFGQYVQFIGDKSTTLCQKIFQEGSAIAQQTTLLTDFLKKYR
jgi:hypothetical protein